MVNLGRCMPSGCRALGGIRSQKHKSACCLEDEGPLPLLREGSQHPHSHNSLHNTCSWRIDLRSWRCNCSHLTHSPPAIKIWHVTVMQSAAFLLTQRQNLQCWVSSVRVSLSLEPLQSVSHCAVFMVSKDISIVPQAPPTLWQGTSFSQEIRQIFAESSHPSLYKLFGGQSSVDLSDVLGWALTRMREARAAKMRTHLMM